MLRGLVWFKNDLRLSDNPCLVQAIKECDELIPVYFLEDKQTKVSAFGTKKMGPIRTQFLWESLTDLDQQLRQLGSGLWVIQGNPAIEIPKLVTQFEVKKLYTKKEIASEELFGLNQVMDACKLYNVNFEIAESHTLYHSLDLPFSKENIPQVFTQFRTLLESKSQVREALGTPTAIPSIPIPPLQLPGQILPIAIKARSAFPFKGGERAAFKRLHSYFSETQAISTYKETGNGLVGENYSSKFSPYLAMGCISARSIYHELKSYEEKFGANESTYWMYFELLWRDYFAFVMEKYPTQLFTKRGLFPSKPYVGKHNDELFQHWVNAQTESDLVNAFMMELKLTGFMSNRGRQIVASYFCHNLHLDWRYGAAYFEQELIDYDPSSNWGNWAYIAGVGNNPRGKSIFNIQKQAADYDANYTFRKLWLNQ